MKKGFMQKLLNRNVPLQREDRKPILQNNNTILDELEQAVNACENPCMQNILNAHQQQTRDQTDLRDLAEFLDVAPDAVPEGPGSCAETWPLLDSDVSGSTNKRRDIIRLIQASVCKHFPQLPAQVEVNLEGHLSAIEETVDRELLKLDPLLRSLQLQGYLIECYRHHTRHRLHVLLKHVTTAKKAFALIEWALCTSLSLELLGNPDLQDRDPTEPVALLLLTDWLPKAEDKLLENVQKDVSSSLEKILQNERNEDKCESDEAFVRLPVDAIQLINAILKRAQEISELGPPVMDRVRNVCFQELHKFVKRYIRIQTEVLENQAEMAKPEAVHFCKTLHTCKQLRLYIQDRAVGNHVHEETITALGDMEDLTQKLLLDKLNEIAESHLKRYFKKDNREIFILIGSIKALFHVPYLDHHQDVLKGVIDKAYEDVSRIYLTHLVQSKLGKLEKNWKDDVGEIVTQDAEELHFTFSRLSPDVRPWNLVLLSAKEMLECRSLDGLKLTMGKVWQDCTTARCTVDWKLLEALLRWKQSLFRWEITEVLEASVPEYQPRPATCCCCLPCY